MLPLLPSFSLTLDHTHGGHAFYVISLIENSIKSSEMRIQLSGLNSLSGCYTYYKSEDTLVSLFMVFFKND